MSGLALASTVSAQSANPLDQWPTRIGSFETGNMYSAGTFELNVGARQTSPDDRAGTGNQNYHGGGSYAFSDRFTMGLEAQNYIDPIGGPIAGQPGLGPSGISQVETTEVALWGKYQIYATDQLSVTGLVSAELFRSLRSDLFGGWNTPQSNIAIGAIKAPITYTFSPKWQIHLTPGVTVMPDEVNGDRFYGTIVSLGAGVSYRPSQRISFFGTIEAPLSGENTIDSSTGDWVKEPVWTAGGRYNVTPRVALEGYVTNGWGVTPATSIMTFWPDGDHILVGGRLVYTPGDKIDESYRVLTLPATQAELNAQQDGFTLGTAATLEPGFVRSELWYGSGNNAGASVNFSTDRDTELQFIFEQYSDNSTSKPSIVPTTDVRYMLGPKLRFMDQDNGNPFSLAGRMLYGRQISSDSVKVGVFYTDLIANYKTKSGLSFTASPKIAAWGSTELVGFGMGLGYNFGNGLELMAEVTPIARDGDETTWAAGARYHFGKSGFSVDAQATNAIGRQGIGGMIAQDDTRFTLTLSKTFDASGLKFY
ncbi:hypothetical protein [Shimia sp. NS0008-38b]|uniref:hypothetical protein n=1 Tax=Shimia sp. NS0008-38b TaxID=3127653 RepID=UPI0033401C3F